MKAVLEFRLPILCVCNVTFAYWRRHYVGVGGRGQGSGSRVGVSVMGQCHGSGSVSWVGLMGRGQCHGSVSWVGVSLMGQSPGVN